MVETWLKNEMELSPGTYIMPNHVILRHDRPTSANLTKGGGIMASVKPDFNPCKIPNIPPMIEIMVTLLSLSRYSKIDIVTAYRCHNKVTPEAFLTQIKHTLTLLDPSTPTIICGDFNIDLTLKPDSMLSDNLQSMGFHQHVNTPTTDYGSCLDHVYTKNIDINDINIHVVDCYFSDHDYIFVSLKIQS